MIQSNVKTQIQKKIFSNGFPKDIDSEKAALACMLLDQTCIEHALNLDVGDSHFYDSRHQAAYNALVDIQYNQACNIDLVVFKNKLKESETFRHYNLKDLSLFIMEIADQPVLPINFPQYITQLEDFKQRRQLLQDTMVEVDRAFDITTPLVIPKDKFSRNIVDIKTWLNESPPKQLDVYKGVLPHGVIGGVLSTGGVGKTIVLTYLAIASATGKSVFDYFYPERPIKVLALLAEDPAEKTWERLKKVVDSFNMTPGELELLTTNLNLICEVSESLMELDLKGNAVVSKTYKCLENLIRSLRPDLIIVDPKSMWYGLDENSNTHNSLWVNALRTMANGATLLFCHHVTKAGGGELELNSSRGGSSLVDGCRWVANLKRMDKKIGDEHDLEDYHKYVQFKITKNSYGPLTNDELYFKFTEDGGLERVQLKQKKLSDIATSIKELLIGSPQKYLSQNEIIKLSAGKFVRESLKDVYGKVSRNNLKAAINFGLTNQILSEIQIESGGKPKVILCS